MSACERNVLNVVRPQLQPRGLGGGSGGILSVDNAEEEPRQTELEPDAPDEEFGQRKCKKMQDPKLPSPEEIAEHDFSHHPCRSWCMCCVRGRARESPHDKSKEKPTMNEVHFDYAFLGKECEPGKLLPVSVVKERITGMTLASVVPSKTTGAFITKRMMAFLAKDD